MAKRYVRTPLVGDPSPVTPPRTVPHVPNISMDGMSTEELFSLALECGIPATELLGIDHCYEHFKFIQLGANSIGKFAYSTDVVWCRNCYLWFRVRK